MAAPSSETLPRYLVAVVAIVLALGVKLLLVPLVTEDSPFILFFLAVMLAAWYGGLGPGLLATALAVIVNNYFFMPPFRGFDWVTPKLQFRMALFCVEGICVSVICHRLRSARLRVEERDEEARQLQRQVLEISDAEQRRVSHDLHDGLGAQLTGIALMTRHLEKRLAADGSGQSEEATKISQLARSALEWTHDLCRSLSPSELETGGLSGALHELAGNSENIFGIRCTVDLKGDVDLRDLTVSVHLYRISQEAISNAVKHGRARNVRIRLAGEDGIIVLTVADDGSGIGDSRVSHDGLGLRIMQYRAKMIGAAIEVRNGSDGGTSVICTYQPKTLPGPQTERDNGKN